MPEQGAVAGQGNVIMGADPATGIAYMAAINPTTKKLTLESAVADGSSVTLGAKADAKSTATDTTPITAMSVWKQISASVQAIAAAIIGTLTVTLAGYSFNNITTAATTVVKSGAGVVHTLTINSLGTVASVTTIYDNTAASGTKIATIDSLNLRGTVLYDVAFSVGLTIVTTGTIAPDITVAYR